MFSPENPTGDPFRLRQSPKHHKITFRGSLVVSTIGPSRTIRELEKDSPPQELLAPGLPSDLPIPTEHQGMIKEMARIMSQFQSNIMELPTTEGLSPVH